MRWGCASQSTTTMRWPFPVPSMANSRAASQSKKPSGSGGQGKTTLAREAVERFAYAWPGGVWAISLETLPARADFVITMARFLGIEASELEQQVLQRLAMHRTLVVLDNAETLDIAVKS